MDAVRINIRLAGNVKERLEFLAFTAGISQTAIIATLINESYEKMAVAAVQRVKKPKRPKHA